MGGGVGQLLGSAGTLLTGGPAGAIASAIGAIKDQIEQGLKSAVQGVGETLRDIASLDPQALMIPVNAFLEKIPLVGPAFAEINKQFASFMAAVDQTAQRLAGYSGELAVASAEAEIRQVFGDIRRAQQLGSGLARFTEAQSQLSQTAQDIEAALLEQFLPLATETLVLLNAILVALQKTPEAAQSALDRLLSKLPTPLLSAIVAGTSVLTKDAAIALAPLLAMIRKIEENTRKLEEEQGEQLLNELFGVRIPFSGFVPPPRVQGFTGG